MLSTTLTGAGFPAKTKESSRFENYNGGVGGGGAPRTNRYTSVNDLEISPGSAREVPEIRGILPSNLLPLVGIRNAAIYL